MSLMSFLINKKYSFQARVDLTMTKDILNYKQEIYTEEDGAMVIKRSLNEHWIVYDLSEAKVTTNMEDNHLQVVMEVQYFKKYNNFCNSCFPKRFLNL